jgi:hypothetical protein
LTLSRKQCILLFRDCTLKERTLVDLLPYFVILFVFEISDKISKMFYDGVPAGASLQYVLYSGICVPELGILPTPFDGV